MVFSRKKIARQGFPGRLREDLKKISKRFVTSLLKSPAERVFPFPGDYLELFGILGAGNRIDRVLESEPIAFRGETRFPFERADKIFQGEVTGILGDFRDGQVGMQKERFRLFHPDLKDIFLGGFIKILSEFTGEGPGREIDMIGDVLDGDSRGGFVPDELNRLGDVMIIDRYQVGRLSGDDVERGDQNREGWVLFSVHPAI